MSKANEAMKNQCVQDMMKNVDGSVENALRFAYNKGYTDAKREGVEGLFNGNGCTILEIEKGYGRFGYAEHNGKTMFVISASENEAEVGSSPDADPTEKPLFALVVRDSEHAMVIAEAFMHMAEYFKAKQEEPEAETADDSDETLEVSKKDWQAMKNMLFKMLAKVEFGEDEGNG